LLKDNFSIVISAPSGAGKTTIIQKMLHLDSRLAFSISTTTRAIRQGETEGVNYNFVSIDEFKLKIEKNEFVEWAMVHGNYYGTTKKEIDRILSAGRILIFDVDVQGAESLRGKLTDCLFLFIIPPSLEILEQRLRNRNSDSEEQISIRLKNAVDEIRKYHIFDYIVVNDSVERALDTVFSIIKAEQHRKKRYEHIIKGFWREQ